MNFAQLRDRVEALVKLGSWSNADPAPDYAYLVNEGLRQFTQRAQHNIENDTITTVSGTAEYTIADQTADEPGWVLLFDDATYGTDKRLYKITEAQVRRRDPMWRQVSNATPTYIWLVNENKVRLHAPPDTSSITVYFRGVRHEPILDGDSDRPLVSEYYHEAIALFGAWSWGKTHARGEELGVLDRFLAEAEKYADECRQQHAAADAEVFSRRKRRAVPEYMWL